MGNSAQDVGALLLFILVVALVDTITVCGLVEQGVGRGNEDIERRKGERKGE